MAKGKPKPGPPVDRRLKENSGRRTKRRPQTPKKNAKR